MRWTPVVPVLAVITGTAACDLTPTSSLRDLFGKQVSLTWSPRQGDPGAMDVRVLLSYRIGECATIDASAKLDGQQLDVLERGSSSVTSHGNPECGLPSWSGIVRSGDPAAATILEIQDEDEDNPAAITYELTNPFAARTIQASTGGTAPVFPGPCANPPEIAGELALPPGQEVTLSWSPATDTISFGTMSGFTAAAAGAFFLSVSDLNVAGATIRFTAPANAGQAARAKLVGRFAPATLRCEGAEMCSTDSEYCGEFAVR